MGELGWAESVNREYQRISRHQTSALMFYDVCTGPSLPPTGVSVVSVVNIGAFLNSLLKLVFHTQFGGKMKFIRAEMNLSQLNFYIGYRIAGESAPTCSQRQLAELLSSNIIR